MSENSKAGILVINPDNYLHIHCSHCNTGLMATPTCFHWKNSNEELVHGITKTAFWYTCPYCYSSNQKAYESEMTYAFIRQIPGNPSKIA